MLGLSAWTFASSIWSISVTRSMLEGERSLVYVSGVLVALLLSRRAGGRAIVIGTWLAITAVCTYALLTRLFPKQFGVFDSLAGNRLSTPIGYWNGLGLLAAIGCLLALGLAARGGVFVRMAAAASTVVLVLTLYFTFGRGGVDRALRRARGDDHRRPPPGSADRDSARGRAVARDRRLLRVPGELAHARRRPDRRCAEGRPRGRRDLLSS